MNRPKGAVLIMEEDASIPAHAKPLMLEAVLFCPILSWMSKRLLADGVRRFFVVCGPRFAAQARACFPEDAEVSVSEQAADLTAFLDTEDPILVFPRAALPAAEAGAGFVYQAAGTHLRESWRERMTNNVSGAELVPGWLPVFGMDTVAELEPVLRERIVKGHQKNGVRMLDPAAVYIDPRAVIGQGTLLLPGTMIRGETVIGAGCTVGPQAVLDSCTLADGVSVNASQLSGSTFAEGCAVGPNAVVDRCAVGDHVIINASQVYESALGAGTDVGPFAHIRPGCTVGPKCHVGAFVQLKNCVLGEGTKMSHLTYVGDADVGAGVNFGCGTITSNYDGFQKFRCTIGDGAFIGCNTNLIAPVTVGAGSYIAAGSTITQEVPPDALAVARKRQENREGWAARRRQLHENKK